MLAVQLPRIQQELASKALVRLESAIDGRLEVGEILIQPFNAVMLKDVNIIDNNPLKETPLPGWEPVDTLFHADIITATLKLSNLIKTEGLHLGRVTLDGGSMHLVIEDGEYPTNLARIFRIVEKEHERIEKGNIFDASKIRVKDFRYRMSDAAKPHRPNDGSFINWQDLDLRAQLRGHSLRLSKSRVSGVVDNLTAVEKCGYRISRASGRARVGMGKTEITNLHLTDLWSDLRIESYTMNYDYSKAFSKYISDVKMGLKIRKGSILSFKSMHAYMGVFPGNEAVLLLDKGSASGYVNDLKVEDLKFIDPDSGIRGSLSCSLLGLPDIQNLAFEATLKDFNATTAGFDRAFRIWTSGQAPGVSSYAPGRSMTLNASARGNLRKMDISLSLGSRIGSLKARADIRNLLNPSQGLDIRGNVSTRDLNLGVILDASALGAVSLESGLKAHLKKGENSVTIDSLKVSRLGALGYDYTNIAATGSFSGTSFDGKVICDDPNLNFLFQGIFNLSGKTSNALYKFYANLGYADLAALNIYKLGEAKLSGQAYANFMRISRGDVIGDVDIRDLVLSGEDGHKNIGDISIASHSNDNLHRIQFKSSFADGGYVGERSFAELFDAIQNVTTRRDVPSLYPGRQKANPDNGASELEFNFHDNWNLLSYFVPDLYIADSTSVRLRIDKRGVLNGSVVSPRVAYGANYVKGLELKLDNLDSSINCILSGKEIRLGPLGFKESTLTAFAENDSFALGFHYDNIAGQGNYGEIYMTGELARDSRDSLVVSAHPLYSYIRFNGEKWDIAESDIIVKGGEVEVDGFRISNLSQSLTVDGKYSPHSTDTLRLQLENFDLSTIDYFLTNPLDLSGSASATGELISPAGSGFGISLKMNCDDVRIAGNPVGKLELEADWDQVMEQYVLNLEDILDGMTVLAANGSYSPSDRSLEANAALNAFSLSPVQPFISSVAGSLSGSLDGRFSVEGTLDSLSFSGENCRLRDVTVELAPTGATYGIDGPFYLNETGIVFENIAIRDKGSGTGSLNGSVEFSGNNPNIDVILEFDEMELINTPESGSLPIYGKLYASGSLHALGDAASLLLDVDVASAGEGQVHVPRSGFATSGETRLLNVKKREVETYVDPYEARMSKLAKGKGGAMDFRIRAQINASEDLEAFMEIDKSTGNVMNIRGNGLVNVEVVPSRDIFTINGDYSISNGRYHLAALGIANRDFSILEGSSIKFNGDILDSDLDVNAVYNLKTSLTALLNDTTAVSTRRLVECGIQITDKIVNPRIGFSINVPDLDPTTKTQVESALNTEDKIQKQFVSLLLTGSFLPSDPSGIVNNTNILYSNVTEIMSGQLNNILQKLNIPVDLGLGYHPNANGTDMFDVAVSTQLFNNRVLVNGTIGNRQYSTSTNPNGDVVGDVDIEVKLDKPGKFRLNLFSHSADEYTSYLDYSQRSGVGLTYQKEYNKFGTFIRELFSGKKKKSGAAEKKNEELVIIDIDE